MDCTNIKAFLRIEHVKLRAQAPAAHGNRTNAPPGSVTFHENLVNGFLCRAQTLKSHRALVRVGNLNPACFKQLNSLQNSLYNVKWLKAGHHHRDLEFFQQWGILVVTHYRINMTC